MAEWSTTIQEEDAEEEEELPLWVQSIYEKWYSFKSTVMNAWRRRGAVRQFLKAVKEGDTTGALVCLAHYPFLLAYGTYAQDGDTVWHLLAEFGDTDLLQALINFCKIHGPKISGSSSRVRRGQSQTHTDDTILRLVNVGNDLKQTPLMFAAYHGRDDVIAFLLKQGADPWASDRCGRRTALHYACMKGYATCVHALLENILPADHERALCRYVNVKTASGFTPLHYAVAANCLPAVRALLSYDARIDEFNMFDAGEFWISCATKSTALHVAATSNRLHCAMAILQYYAESRKRLGLEDPRCWCDKRGRTPQDVARSKVNDDMATILEPGSKIEHLSYAVLGAEDCWVPKLQAIAAKAVKANLLASIQEAEEFMKLLGTHQQHGRVFARLAYDSEQPASTGSTHDSSGPGITTKESLKEILAKGPGDRSGRAMSPSGKIQSGGFNTLSSGEPSTVTTSSRSLTDRGSRDPQGSSQKVVRQSTIKQWLSYERKAEAAASARAAAIRNARRPPMKERSTLSQINPNDEHVGCMSGCMSSVGLRPKQRYMLPSPGDDVCGTCQDNKPLLAMQYCGHKTCLLCAKSMLYVLDLNQLVLCPYCGSLVSSFGLS